MVPLLERATGLFKGRLNCQGPLGLGLRRFGAQLADGDVQVRAVDTPINLYSGHGLEIFRAVKIRPGGELGKHDHHERFGDVVAAQSSEPLALDTLVVFRQLR